MVFFLQGFQTKTLDAFPSSPSCVLHVPPISFSLITSDRAHKLGSDIVLSTFLSNIISSYLRVWDQFSHPHPQFRMLSRRLLTAESRVQSQDTPYRICGGQMDTGLGFYPRSSVLPCQSMSICQQGLIQQTHLKPQYCAIQPYATPITTKHVTDISL
jgi:hypothetical protein